MGNSQFVIDGLLLTLDEPSYIVLVDECDQDRSLHTPNDLPDWVFKSQFAIWLIVGEESIRLRAFEGENIRRQFLAYRETMAFQKAG